MKFSKLSLFVLFVLISGYARSQCNNLRFSSTANTWPTVNPLPVLGTTQYLCLTQNLTTPLPAAVRVYTSTSGGATGVSWQPLGTGITLTNQSNSFCDFQFALGTSPFDFGKCRIKVTYNGGVCKCSDTLDIYRVMNPQSVGSFPPIQGPVCLAPGQVGSYYVDPRFSRPANISLGIGVDGYDWSVLNDNTVGVGDWTQGATPGATAGLLASGDNSAT